MGTGDIYTGRGVIENTNSKGKQPFEECTCVLYAYVIISAYMSQ